VHGCFSLLDDAMAEVQVRTLTMHKDAEHGTASHSLYKVLYKYMVLSPQSSST
jgi:(p)ppGpp synthase/HD superfamily hydrolase